MDNNELSKLTRAAIKDGDVDKFLSLVESNDCLLNTMTTFGTWLHVAATFGKVDIVKHLLKLGANVNAKGGIAGSNPLHLAASKGHIDVVKCLLDYGAEMDIAEPHRNPLFGAIYGGHAAIAKLLIDEGIDTQIKYTGDNMKNMDALAFAHEWGRTDIAALLNGGGNTQK